MTTILAEGDLKGASLQGHHDVSAQERIEELSGVGGNVLVFLLEGDSGLMHGLELLGRAGTQDIPQEEDVSLRIAN